MGLLLSKFFPQMSAMPLPPEQYVKHYTDEMVSLGRAPPPPPPIKDNYSMFGHPFSADDSIIRSLESQGIRRLYPASKVIDRKQELHKLNHSILINFLDLIDLLIKAPESAKREEKIDDLNLLFIHMHHLVIEIFSALLEFESIVNSRSADGFLSSFPV